MSNQKTCRVEHSATGCPTGNSPTLDTLAHAIALHIWFRFVGFFDWFVTDDYFSIWRTKWIGTDDGQELRNQMSKRYGNFMVFLALMLNAQLSVLFSSSIESTAVRQSMTFGTIDSLHFWTGLVIHASVICTILSLASTFTAWSMLSTLNKENAKLFPGQLPERLIAFSIHSFLAWAVMFSGILLPKPACGGLLGCLAFGLFVHTLLSFHRFWRSTLQFSPVDSDKNLGRTKGPFTRWNLLFGGKEGTKPLLSAEPKWTSQIFENHSRSSFEEENNEIERGSFDGCGTQDCLDQSFLFSDDTVILPSSTKPRNRKWLYAAPPAEIPDTKMNNSSFGELSSVGSDDPDQLQPSARKTTPSILRTSLEVIRVFLGSSSPSAQLPQAILSDVCDSVPCLEYGHNQVAHQSSSTDSNAAERSVIAEATVENKLSWPEGLGEGYAVPNMDQDLATESSTASDSATITGGSDEENPLHEVASSLETNVVVGNIISEVVIEKKQFWPDELDEEYVDPKIDERHPIDQIPSLSASDVCVADSATTEDNDEENPSHKVAFELESGVKLSNSPGADVIGLSQETASSVKGNIRPFCIQQYDLSSHYDCEFQASQDDEEVDFYNNVETGIFRVRPENVLCEQCHWIGMDYDFPLSKEPSADGSLGESPNDVDQDIETAALLWLTTMTQHHKDIKKSS